MLQGLILADDFTGALDTAVQFAERGMKVQVLDSETTSFQSNGTDILVIDTESRNLPREEAIIKVSQPMKDMKGENAFLLYKKTDSLLRGNIGGELEAILSISGRSAIFFVPAFPEMGRTVTDGKLFVNGELLTNTVYSKDRICPVNKDKISDIIREQSNLSVVEVRTSDAIPMEIKDSVIYVFDGCTEEGLKELARKIVPVMHWVVLAGCAGFAKYISRYWKAKPMMNNKTFVAIKKHIIVCGSINANTLEQIRFAVENGVVSYKLLPEEYVCENLSEDVRIKIKNLQKKFSKILFYTADKESDLKEAQMYAQRKNISISELGRIVAERLGEIVELCAKEEGIVSVIGGDTLYQSMKKMEYRNVQPIKEWKEGVVISKVYLKNGGEKIFLSKAGSFGTKSVIWEMFHLTK